MNKHTHVFLLSSLLLFFINVPIHATEANHSYFGVGAEVQQITSDVYRVNTKGESANEGFVFTPKNIEPNKTTTFHIELRGKSKEVYLKIEETDAKGRFIQDHYSEAFSLSEKWETYKMNVQLSSNTTQLDVFVLTKNKDATPFEFRNVQMKQE